MTPKLKCQMRLNALRRYRVSEKMGNLQRAVRDGNTDSWTREDLSRAEAEYADLHREFAEYRRQM